MYGLRLFSRRVSACVFGVSADTNKEPAITAIYHQDGHNHNTVSKTCSVNTENTVRSELCAEVHYLHDRMSLGHCVALINPFPFSCFRPSPVDVRVLRSVCDGKHANSYNPSVPNRNRMFKLFVCMWWWWGGGRQREWEKEVPEWWELRQRLTDNIRKAYVQKTGRKAGGKKQTVEGEWVGRGCDKHPASKSDGFRKKSSANGLDMFLHWQICPMTTQAAVTHTGQTPTALPGSRKLEVRGASQRCPRFKFFDVRVVNICRKCSEGMSKVIWCCLLHSSV